MIPPQNPMLSWLDINHSNSISGDYNWWRVVKLSPIAVAPRPKAWTVFARSNAGIVSSSPTRGMDDCVRFFCVCVVLCVDSGLAMGWSPVQKVLPTVIGLRNSSETMRFTDDLCSRWEQQERERERGLDLERKWLQLIWNAAPAFVWGCFGEPYFFNATHESRLEKWKSLLTWNNRNFQ
jgi:hypothetical protein